MLTFQFNLNNNANPQITDEMVNALAQAAITAVRNKAQELYLNCSTDVNINVNVEPNPEPT